MGLSARGWNALLALTDVLKSGSERVRRIDIAADLL
jgi:hypothetical protein